MHLDTEQVIRVGQLGRFKFSCGYYAYTGSARGPGGLATRLRRHLQTKKRLHWHIDYLLKFADVVNYWYCEDGLNHEHQWAKAFQQLKGASIPIEGFGSTDCQCRSHLIQFNPFPQHKTILRLLESSSNKVNQYP